MPSSARIAKPAWTQSSTVNRLVAAPARSMAIIDYAYGGSAIRSSAAGPVRIDYGVTINFAYE